MAIRSAPLLCLCALPLLFSRTGAEPPQVPLSMAIGDTAIPPSQWERMESVQPPPSALQLAGQSALGLAGGLALAYAAGYAGAIWDRPHCDEGEWGCGLVGAFAGVLIGYPLGTALGVKAGAKLQHRPGRLDLALLGSCAGEALDAIILAAVNDRAHGTPAVAMASALFLALPNAGAVAAYNFGGPAPPRPSETGRQDAPAGPRVACRLLRIRF